MPVRAGISPARLLIVALLLAPGLAACEGVGPLLRSMLPTLDPTKFAPLPAMGTPVEGLSFPTIGPPAPVGVEVILTNLAITVDDVVRPATAMVGSAADYKPLEQGQEYLAVKVWVRCISDEKCRITEFDFGVDGASGKDYPAEFASGFSGLDDLFEAADIQPGQGRGGWLLFIVDHDDSDLILSYPRMFGFASTARFWLGK